MSFLGKHRQVADYAHPQQYRAALTLAALGIVYGDIGTSSVRRQRNFQS